MTAPPRGKRSSLVAVAPVVVTAQEHRVAQATLAELAGQQAIEQFGVLDLSQLKATTPRLAAIIQAIVVRFGGGAAGLARRQYLQDRRLAGIRTPFTPRAIAPPGDTATLAQVEWAVSDLYGPMNPEPVTIRGVEYAPIDERIAHAQTKLAGVTEQVVQRQGIDQTVDTVQRDRTALGYVRVTEPDPCYFCALLAIRGPVYKDGVFSKSDAKRVPHVDTISDAKVHDHCRCHMQAVFSEDYSAPADVAKWESDYYAATENVSGMEALQLAWRQAYEGRAN